MAKRKQKYFHAHIYFDAESRPKAARLRRKMSKMFSVKIGPWRHGVYGPHPCSNFQVAFEPKDFGAFVPWLTLNRNGLDVLVHPSTGQLVADHVEHAMWLGKPRRIRRSFLEKAQLKINARLNK